MSGIQWCGEHELWRHALEHARGQNITLAEIQTVTRRRDYVRDVERPGYVAERGALERESAIVKMEILGDGRITLADGRALSANYRRFTHGYAVTSYAAQGKTVGHVLFSDSASRPATSAQQWYVTISRGRKGIAIFTSDPEQLPANITRSGERPLAMELK